MRVARKLFNTFSRKSEDQREFQVISDVWGCALELKESPEGYLLRYPDSRPWKKKLTHFLELAPSRYQAMEFKLQRHSNHLWLDVTGASGTKDFVVSANYLLNSTLNPRRTKKYFLELSWRRATATWRALPGFIIFGSMKSGTTSLYSYLVDHPSVESSLRKETYFFNIHYSRGTNFYRAFFPLRATRGGRKGWIQTGEATPFYIYHPDVPGRIHALLPDIRLIAILRNPVERAYSHYNHRIRMGLEPLSFAEGLEAEEKRLYMDKPEKGPFSGMNSRIIASGYKRMGEYADQLKPWFEQFSRDQLLILSLEELAARPVETYARVTDHLGLARNPDVQFDVRNSAPYEAMPQENRAQLEDYFRSRNAALYRLIGRDLHWDSA